VKHSTAVEQSAVGAVNDLRKILVVVVVIIVVVVER
jgi:hypothetical protein